MDDNAPAHRGCINREWLLKTGVPHMEWPALSPDLNPIENLWDKASFCVEAGNFALLNLNDLTVIHQEKWGTMHQETVS